MSRNRKNKVLLKPNGEKKAISQFKEFLCEAMKLVGYEEYFPLIKESEFKFMNISMLKPTRPTRFPDHQIPSKKLQEINNLIHIGLRFKFFDIEDIRISVMEYNSLYALSRFLEQQVDGIERLASLRSKFCARFQSETLMGLLNEGYNTIFIQMIFSLSNPQQKYYTYKNSLETVRVNPFYVRVNSSILVHHAQSHMLMIHGAYRPVFRLGRPDSDCGLQWLSVPASLVGDHYKGKQKELGLYIQSHALNRLRERLDIIDEHSLNYYLMLRTYDIKAFECYKGYLLLPLITFFEAKVGYLAANVIGDKLVFRTFLFVTHNCTPEGDKLKEVSGLQKSDIKYWQIDRLSTIVSANVETNPSLHNLLKEAGIDNLLDLKKIVDKSENMQDRLAGELMAYIEKGKKELEVAESS